MNYHNIEFPYPVLRKDHDDIDGNIDYEVSSIEEREDAYLININFFIDNEDILTLIRENKAEYAIEVTCSDTLYRKMYLSTKKSMEFKILKTDVKGKVFAECFILAKKGINNYQNKKAHPDYGNFEINLSKGDVLAYFGRFDFTARIDYKKLKAVASFMEVIEGNGETVHVNLDSDKILIELPENDFNHYKKIGKEKTITPVIHASLVLNALLIALHNIEEYSEKLWAKALKYRLENEQNLKKIPFDKENIPRIAQLLLGKPFSRLMKQLSEISHSNEQE